jgi:hypothetical protein
LFLFPAANFDESYQPRSSFLTKARAIVAGALPEIETCSMVSQSVAAVGGEESVARFVVEMERKVVLGGNLLKFCPGAADHNLRT